MQIGSVALLPGRSYTITVGNGGLGMIFDGNVYKGGVSSIIGPGISFISYGGAGGAGLDWDGGTTADKRVKAYSASNYGCGGGGWWGSTHLDPSGAGCTATNTSFCTAGGDGYSYSSLSFNEPAGGGGGAGGAGLTATSSSQGAGGPGRLWPFSGKYYAGGGGAQGVCDGRGGSSPIRPGQGGIGGGGAGGACQAGFINGVSGTIHTGGGGGGGSFTKNGANAGSAGTAGKGGSGVVILAIPGTATSSIPPVSPTSGQPSFLFFNKPPAAAKTCTDGGYIINLAAVFVYRGTTRLTLPLTAAVLYPLGSVPGSNVLLPLDRSNNFVENTCSGNPTTPYLSIDLTGLVYDRIEVYTRATWAIRAAGMSVSLNSKADGTGARGWTSTLSNALCSQSDSYGCVYYTFYPTSQCATTRNGCFGTGVTTRGLALYLDAASYSGSGNWVDSVGGLPFQLLGTGSTKPTYSSTIGGGSFSFDGKSQYALSSQSLPSTLTMTTWTVEAWIAADAGATANAAIVAEVYITNIANSVNYVLGMYFGGAYATYYGPYWYGSGSTAPITYSSSSWVHIVCQYDGYYLKTYVNGVLQLTVAAGVTPDRGGQGIILMKRWDDSTASNFVGGNLAVVRIYNRALTGSEISTNFATEAARFGMSPSIYLDGLTLCDLYNSVPSSGQTGPLSTWCKSNYDPCSTSSAWAGVTCSNVGGVQRVTKLNLRTTAYGGSSSAALGGGFLPSSIGNMGALTLIDLTGNSIGGSLPSSLWTLTALKFLGVGVNKLTGTLSSSVGGLTGLSALALDTNSLVGSLPSSLGGLTGLSELWLMSDGFTGTVPTSFCNLPRSMNVLYINSNPGLVSAPSCLTTANYPHLSKDASLALAGQFYISSFIQSASPYTTVSTPGYILSDARQISLVGAYLGGPAVSNNNFVVGTIFKSSLTWTASAANWYVCLFDGGYIKAVAIQVAIDSTNSKFVVKGLSAAYKSGTIMPTSVSAFESPTVFSGWTSHQFSPSNSVMGYGLAQVTFALDYDGIALCDFYNAVTNTAPLVNWCQGSTYNPCYGPTWTGVTCGMDASGNYRVTSLNVGVAGSCKGTLSASLNGGSLPASIGNLGALTQLRLSCNSLGGALPLSLGQLTGLQILDVSNNNFTGPLLSSLGGMPGLTSLNVNRNSFNGAIPTSICSLPTSISSLTIQSNSFACLPSCLTTTNYPNLVKDASLTTVCTAAQGDGQVLCELHSSAPSSGKSVLTNWCGTNTNPCSTSSAWAGVTCSTVGGVQRVTSLSLNSCSDGTLSASLAGARVPPSIGNLGALTSLFFGCTSLVGSLPYSIGQLTALQSMDIFTNMITALPGSLGQLTGLKFLSVCANKIVGSLPSSLGLLTGLTYMDLSYNSFTGSLPTFLGQLTGLQILSVQSNSFTGAVPSSFCSPTTSINPLYVALNPGLACLPSCLTTYANLRKDSTLTASCGTAQGDGGLLCDLYSTATNTAPLSNWGCQGSAPYNPCSGSGWTGVVCGTVGGVQRVTSLSLLAGTCGSIGTLGGSSVPASIGSLGALTHLDLCGTSFGGTLPSTLGLLTGLQKLELGLNSFTGTLPDFFAGLTGLTWFSVESNSLKGTLPSSLGQLTGLQIFSLSKNNLVGTLPSSLWGLTSLTYWSFYSNNFVGTLSSAIGQLTGLQTLNGGNNHFTGSLPSLLGGLTALTNLGFGFNSFSGSLPSSLGLLTKLQYLYLYLNSFSGAVPFSFCNLPTSISDLHIESNPGLTCLPSCLTTTNYPHLVKDASLTRVCTTVLPFSYAPVTVLKTGNLLGTLSSLPQIYTLSFDIYPNPISSTTSTWRPVFWLAEVSSSNRLPSVYLPPYDTGGAGGSPLNAVVTYYKGVGDYYSTVRDLYTVGLTPSAWTTMSITVDMTQSPTKLSAILTGASTASKSATGIPTYTPGPVNIWATPNFISDSPADASIRNVAIVAGIPTLTPTSTPTVAPTFPQGALSYTISAAAPQYGGYAFSSIQTQDGSCWLGPDRLPASFGASSSPYSGSGDPTFFFVLDTGGVHVISTIVVQQCSSQCAHYAIGTMLVSASNDGVNYGSAVSVSASLCAGQGSAQPVQMLPVGITGRYIKVLAKSYGDFSTGADYIGLIGYS